jgi:hypothetical protein
MSQTLSKSTILASSAALVGVWLLVMALGPDDPRMPRTSALSFAHLDAVAARIEARGQDCAATRRLIMRMIETRRHFSKRDFLGTMPYFGLDGREVSLIKPEIFTLYDLQLDTPTARAHLDARCAGLTTPSN